MMALREDEKFNYFFLFSLLDKSTSVRDERMDDGKNRHAKYHAVQ